MGSYLNYYKSIYTSKIHLTSKASITGHVGFTGCMPWAVLSVSQSILS